MTALDIAEIVFIVLVAGVGLGLIIKVLKEENKTSKQSDFIMKEYATSLEYEQSYLHKKTGGKK